MVTPTSTYPTICREWTKLQVQEKEHRANEEEYSKKLYDLKAIELDERLVALTIAEQETKRRINMATKELNRQQVCMVSLKM